VSRAAQDIVVKIVTALVVVVAVMGLGDRLDAKPGVFGTLWAVAVFLFLLVTAIGFWRYQGWAFVVVSLGLLWGWVTNFIAMVAAFADGHGDVGRPHLFELAGITLIIALIGRWSMERRFRPHLDIDHD